MVVKAELPGVKKEDVRVELDDGDLVIHGESRQEKEIKEEKYRRMERSFGAFHRRLPLPADVQPEQIRASMAEGILEVRVPIPAGRSTEPKRIQVS